MPVAPLDKRIASALIGDAPETGVARTYADTRVALTELEAEADRLDLEALSPALALEAAEAKRAEAADARFRADRLDAAVSALAVRLDELREQTLARRTAESQDAAITARDALAAEIRETYPRLVRELTSLAKRIAENNIVCAQAGVPANAETQGRGIPEGFFAPGLGTMVPIMAMPIPLPASPLLAWDTSSGSGPSNWRGLRA